MPGTPSHTFADKRIGGFTLLKLDEETRQPIPGVPFEIRTMDGAFIGTYETDASGMIHLNELADGWYTVQELKPASGYIADSEPKRIKVRDGQTEQLVITNRKESNFLIRKVDSVTGKGIYGVTFLISDANNNPVATVTSGQKGLTPRKRRQAPPLFCSLKARWTPSCALAAGISTAPCAS